MGVVPRMLRSSKSAKYRKEFEREALPHLDALYRAALRLTRSESDACDLVQDTYLKAYGAYGEFQAGTHIKAWLFRIQMNAFINRYRRRVRERDATTQVNAAVVGDGVLGRATVDPLDRPAAQAERRLVARELEEALARLPEDYRTVVVLADVEGFSYREIADIIGCPIGTVMSRLHRGRRGMQRQLQLDEVSDSRGGEVVPLHPAGSRRSSQESTG